MTERKTPVNNNMGNVRIHATVTTCNSMAYSASLHVRVMGHGLPLCSVVQHASARFHSDS